jgi:predicted transposase
LSTLLLSRDNIEDFVEAVTINGKLVVENSEDYMKLVRLSRAYSKAVKAMINLVLRDIQHTEACRRLYNILPNYVYLETAYKNAKAIVEGLRETSGSKCEIKRFWISSRGNKFDYGNRNIRLTPRGKHYEVLVKYPWDLSWIRAKAFFGSRYIRLLDELVELSSRREEGYGVTISFRNHPRIHVHVPTWLYLKHFSENKAMSGKFIAGVDLNSDRVNLVVIDSKGEIVYIKSSKFPEATSHGFPRDLAKQKRLYALYQAIDLATLTGASIIAFENLFEIKKKKFTINHRTNRKISKFAKKQLLTHGILRAIKMGFKIILIDPKGTTKSKEHDGVMKRHGLDKHSASAYLIALKGLSKVNNVKPFKFT